MKPDKKTIIQTFSNHTKPPEALGLKHTVEPGTLSIIDLCSNLTVPTPINESKGLEPIDILYLIVLLKASKRHSPDIIYGLDGCSPLVPLDDNKVFIHLLNKGIISLAPDSPYNSRTNKTKSINPFEENWQSNLSCGFSYISIHQAHLKDPNILLTVEKKWKPHLRKIWLDISLNECLEYLILKLFEHGLQINITTNLKQTLLKLLKYISPSQCFQLISNISLSCKTRYAMKDHNRAFITDFILSELELAIDKLHQGKFGVSGMDRPLTCPRSILSEVFFNELRLLQN